MDPVSYLSGLKASELRTVASAIGTTPGQLRNIKRRKRSLSPLYAVRMERHTGGLVPRHLSRPDDWEETWPEYAAQHRERAPSVD